MSMFDKQAKSMSTNEIEKETIHNFIEHVTDDYCISVTYTIK